MHEIQEGSKMTQILRTAKELAYFIDNLNLDEGKNDKLMAIICKYVELNRDEAWNDSYDARGY